MEPKSDEATRADETTPWIVWRIDDNGNTFAVQDGLTKQAADRLVEEFTARGHKQTYWAERSTGD